MPHKYNEKMFDIKHLRETAEKLKNWGRWGPDDEIGTLNFITPDKVIDASNCLLYTSPSPRDSCASRMPSSA